jgi:hypothetical protein
VNQTGCPPGWATDEIMFYGNPPASCDMSVGAWIFLALFAIVIKFITALGHSYLWMKRKEFMQTSKNHAVQGLRFPLVPILTWLLLVVFVLMFVLTSLNLVNVKNNGAAFLFGVGWLIYGIFSNVFLVKFIGLGHRMLPNSRVRAFVKGKSARLSKLNIKGKVSLFFSLIALICQTVALCIVSLFVTDNFVVVRVAAAFQFWFCTQHGISMMIHFERVMRS